MSPLLSRVRWPMAGRTPFTSYLGRMVSRKMPLWGEQQRLSRARRAPGLCLRSLLAGKDANNSLIMRACGT